MITAMTTALAFLILIAPFVLAATLSWASHRRHIARGYFEDDRDAHDVDAIRTRFERQPFWPASGATGERR
jgi:hypothetical protein